MSAAKIDSLLKGSERYAPETVEVLQEYVKEQLNKGEYSLDANLALLKLYLLYPESTNMEAIEGVLLKALMAFPATDFSLCMYLIPEKYHAELKEVTDLATQLELAKFKSFWKMAEGVEKLKKATGWESSVRLFIAGVISSTYRSVKAKQILDLLNLPESELDGMMKQQGWSKSKEDKEAVIVNTEKFESKRLEQERATQQPTNMSLDQYRKLFTAATNA
jgi:translation initiation factor 3 subunit K